MADYQLYDLEISTLTPIHIGNGAELLHRYDYIISRGKTWRIDDNALLDAQDVTDIKLAEKLAQIAPAELLKPEELYAGSPFVRYVIDGAPRSEADGAKLREALKDSADQAYLPGSSIKGAFRTLLAWHGWQERKLTPDIQKLGSRREWAGQFYERELFGRSPNYDLLRALQVSDAHPLADSGLMVANARVLGRGGRLGSPIELEAIRPDSVFSLTVKVDTVLFSDWAKRAELDPRQSIWLQNLVPIAQRYSQERIRREIKWLSEMRTGEVSVTAITQFYQQLAQAKLGSRRFLLQLGWGTGWEGKTFGSNLQTDQRFLQRVVTQYRLARGQRKEGDPFPKSRRVAVQARRQNDGRITEIPSAPWGWCLVEMKERK